MTRNKGHHHGRSTAGKRPGVLNKSHRGPRWFDWLIVGTVLLMFSGLITARLHAARADSVREQGYISTMDSRAAEVARLKAELDAARNANPFGNATLVQARDTTQTLMTLHATSRLMALPDKRTRMLSGRGPSVFWTTPAGRPMRQSNHTTTQFRPVKGYSPASHFGNLK